MLVTTEQSCLDKLKQDIATAGISEQVIFTGFTDRIGDYQQICDCVVLVSNAETFGLVLIEAMQVTINRFYSFTRPSP